MDYKRNSSGNVTVVWFDRDGYRVSFIDPSPGNSDYQAYLAWLAEGNQPEEAQQ